FAIQAKQVVNAAGSWIDGIRQLVGLTDPILQNSKGIHLIVDRVADYPLILSTPVRGQIFFVIPVGRHLSLVGTTDTPYPESPDEVRPAHADVAELLGHLFRFFPQLRPAGESLEEAVKR